MHVIIGAGSGIRAAAILQEKWETVVGVDLNDTGLTAGLTQEGCAGAVKDALAATGGRVEAVIALR
ncbi:hypothetical protein [Micrococcus luteus]|uniref:hypothetical protein n=1 Tax=Micrococcus luteus TaxID=1270 RepID=UPI0020CCCEA9|nr:hypothetical protein [Micrococcus luteus]UTT45640.1 hypothetical protein NMQ02_11110 [Micrococcus luteus]